MAKKKTRKRTTKKKTARKAAKRQTAKRTPAAKKKRIVKKESTPKGISRPETATKPVKKKSSLSAKEMKLFKKLLIAKRKILIGDVSLMTSEALEKDPSEAGSNDISNFADLGTDAFEQEVTIGRIESEVGELRKIQEAIERIQDGSYGLCEECEKGIPKARLKALPFALHCIDCQRKLEEQEAF